MKLIRPSYEIIPQQNDLEGVYKQIEIAGRTCYKSEDKITPDSAKSFVDRMIKSGHGAMLEHGTIYLKLPIDKNDYLKNKYSKSHIELNTSKNKDSISQSLFIGNIYVTTNLRVLVENDWLDDLQYICEPTKYHEKRVSVRFICDRGVSHEFVRHRVFSFAQESTRYCNYSKDKFGNELTFIIPNWTTIIEGIYNQKDLITEYDRCNIISDRVKTSQECSYLRSLLECEKRYFDILKTGWTPQQARSVLPNSLKTELVMTGFVSDWEHFFELRTPSSAHPQARQLAIPLQEEFKELGYV